MPTEYSNTLDPNVILAIVYFLKTLKWLAIIGGIILAIRAIIKAIGKKETTQQQKDFDYDYLARRIAEEICTRMLIIRSQNATPSAEDLEQITRTGTAEQNGSRQE